VVVVAVLKTIPALGDVLLVVLLFFFIFSVLGVSLLSGAMHGEQQFCDRQTDSQSVR
jgi:hypothetical protein